MSHKTGEHRIYLFTKNLAAISPTAQTKLVPLCRVFRVICPEHVNRKRPT